MAAALAGLGALPTLPRRRVVVTGVGAVTPLGLNVKQTWEALLAGRSATRALTTETVSGYVPSFLKNDEERQRALMSLPSQVAAPVVEKELMSVDSTDTPVNFAANTRETRAQRMAMYVVASAWGDAQQQDRDGGSHTCKPILSKEGGSVPHHRVGVNFGMGMPGLSDVAEASWHLYGGSSGMHANRIVPYFVPKVLGNTMAGSISLRYGFSGPNHASITACATGAHCIGDAVRWIQAGYADVAVAGASESCITPVSIAGFCRMKALATKYNDTPSTASRPFDQTRAGFVMGEGAGALVLETLESALDRGAFIYGEVRGYGLSGDAYHVSQPHPEGVGIQHCVQAALEDGGCSASSVGYANAHATSTPVGDEIELATLSRCLRPTSAQEGEDVKGTQQPSPSPPALLVSSSKGALGHLLGAAGAVEGIVALMALQNRLAPPTANLTQPVPHDESKTVLLQESQPLPPETQCVISTSFGFGGTNAALLFARV